MNVTYPDALQRLADIEEIRQLKARYCNYADSGVHAQEFAELFLEDGILDEGEDGVFRGRAAILEMYLSLSPHCSINQHLVLNPVIDIDGDVATGNWRLLQLLATRHPEGERAYWACGYYQERYRRHDGHWKFAHVEARVHFCCDYADGWANSPSVSVFPAGALTNPGGP